MIKATLVVSTSDHLYGAWGKGKDTFDLILVIRPDDVFSWAWMGSQVEVFASPGRGFIELLNQIWS